MVDEQKYNRGMAIINFVAKEMECGNDASFYSCETFHRCRESCQTCPMYTNHSIGGGNVQQQCALILLRETILFMKQKGEMLSL